VYADNRCVKAVKNVKKSPGGAGTSSSRSDLLEDTLVASIKRVKGVMSIKNADHVEL
jgi:hypothetical protein